MQGPFCISYLSDFGIKGKIKKGFYFYAALFQKDPVIGIYLKNRNIS